MPPASLGPWPDLATARSFLAFLAGLQEMPASALQRPDTAQLARWLIAEGLGPLAYARCAPYCPGLAGHLQADRFAAAAESALFWHDVQEIATALAAEALPAVLLKGAALAETVYEDRDQRTMSDVDLWIRDSDFPAACRLMEALGFVPAETQNRPAQLQMLANGERRFYRPGWHNSLVELHLSPFSGWWLKRAAAVDDSAVWARTEPLPGWDGLRQLAAEDMIIHLAVHLAVNHQCGLAALRSLMDIALTAGKRGVDWDLVAWRAEHWRVGTAVWLVLFLLEQLVGVPGLERALAALRPRALRRLVLKRLISPESVLLGDDLRNGRQRFWFLLLIIDRFRDAGALLFRALWPEPQWLAGRYGGSPSRWQHLRYLLKHGQI